MRGLTRQHKLDEVVARLVVAPPYANGRSTRLAVDVDADGHSLSTALDAAPFEVEEIRSLGLATRWLPTGNRVPLVNCECGDFGCGGIAVDVVADGPRVTWKDDRLPRDLTFDADTLRASVRTALDSSG